MCRDISECIDSFAGFERNDVLSNSRLKSKQTLIPRMNFACDGNITSLSAALDRFSVQQGQREPVGFHFQIWVNTELSPSRVNYSLVTQTPFRTTASNSDAVYRFTVDPPIPVSSGQFIGYSPDYVTWSTSNFFGTQRGTYIREPVGTFSPGASITLSQQTSETPNTP